MPEREGRNPGGILVAADLVRAIKLSYLVRLSSECIVVVASYGLRSEIYERGHDARHAYRPTSFTVKTSTSPVEPQMERPRKDAKNMQESHIILGKSFFVAKLHSLN